MWAMEMTVAATYHGRPIKEQAAIRMPTHSRSRWYPQPFCSKQSESVRKSMEMKRTQVMKDLLSAWIPLTYFPCGWRWQHWSADPWRWGWWPGARGQSLPGKPTTDSFRMASQTNPCQDVWATWFEKEKNDTTLWRTKEASLLKSHKPSRSVLFSTLTSFTLTLKSVGTMSLGVCKPISMSSPTNVMMDMKMEKSLINFLS